MNLCYYGQIVALAQYFSKRHSIATSISMVGIGAGVFILVPLLEYLVEYYGWRGSFLIYSGISLHVCVFSCLVFPLRPYSPPQLLLQEDESTRIGRKFEEEFGSGSVSVSGRAPTTVPGGNKLLINQHLLISRSISSFKLSLGAGYLSSSIASLNDSQQGIRSNQHSFCSRGSHFTTGIASHQMSFSHRDSHQDLGWSPFLKSNQHSFCSRGSYYGLQSLRSIGNNSFSIKNSNDDLHHWMQPRLSICSKDADIEAAIRNKRYFHCLNNKECTLSVCKEDHYSQDEQEEEKPRNTCVLLMEKIINALRNSTCFSLLADPVFWLLNLTSFFITLATAKIFVVYKDLCTFLGFPAYYSTAISVIGIGDVCGRIIMGAIISLEGVNIVACYTPAMLLSGLSLCVHLIADSPTALIVAASLFGLTYGGSNILFAVVPTAIFGKEKLVVVFGYALFASGIGAIVGAPLDGLIVDKTGRYEGVVYLSLACCIMGGICMTICFFLIRRKSREPRTIAQIHIESS